MAEIQNLKISNVETIEIKLQAGKKRYFFTEVSDLLKGKKVVDVVAPSDNYPPLFLTVMTPDQYKEYLAQVVLKTPSGNIVYPPAKVFLTLNSKGKECVNKYNLSLLSPVHTQLRPSFNDLVCDWSKSYIDVDIVSYPLVEIADCSVMLSILFND
jgi:hypothetical protein